MSTLTRTFDRLLTSYGENVDFGSGNVSAIIEEAGSEEDNAHYGSSDVKSASITLKAADLPSDASTSTRFTQVTGSITWEITKPPVTSHGGYVVNASIRRLSQRSLGAR